jgi:outer membrane protein TolC
MKFALIAIVALSGCAMQPTRQEPPAVVEASCPSTLLFTKEPSAGWQAIYEDCRRAVFGLTAKHELPWSLRRPSDPTFR